MSRTEKVVTCNSLTPTFYKLCTYLSTAIVDKFRPANRYFAIRNDSTTRNAEFFPAVLPHRQRFARVHYRSHKPAPPRDVFSTCNRIAIAAIALAENTLPIYSYAD
jgi:hypothetical protein